MGCTDCFQTQIQLNQQFTIVHANASEYAAKNNVNVFIYREPEGWAFMAEEAARRLGISPTWGVVSGFEPAVV
jgi:hypothetical protein